MNRRLVIGVGVLLAVIVAGMYANNEVRSWLGAHSAARNRIVNGDFGRWPAGGHVTVDPGSSGVTAEGWVAIADGPGGVGRAEFSRRTLNRSGQPPLPLLRWSQLHGATAGEPSLTQSIQGVGTLAGGAAVLSFYARSDGPVDMIAMLVQGFGTSAHSKVTADRVAKVVRFTLNTQWQTFVFPVSLPEVRNVHMGDRGTDVLRLTFVPDHPKAAFTLEITQVQLESSRSRTPSEVRTAPPRAPAP